METLQLFKTLLRGLGQELPDQCQVDAVLGVGGLFVRIGADWLEQERIHALILPPDGPQGNR